MGLAIPQVVSQVEDRASGAQVIEGSLKFGGVLSPHYLSRTLGSGDTKTWTFSYWIKFDQTKTSTRYISTGYSAGGNTYGFYIGENSGRVTFNDTGTNAADYNVRPNAQLRDTGWYHLVFNLDTTESNSDDRVRIYINGVQQINFNTNTRPDEDATGNMNSNGLVLSIGAWNYPAGGGYSDALEGQISQFYHIDGQALDPSYFGFTDPLTGVWRPKKFSIDDAPTTDWGTNGFYLPLDGSGSGSIGQDQSGKGNDFTPKNFGGLSEISKATGALPILDTVNGGKIALPKARGSVGVAVTVAGKTGGGNAYYLDGVEAKTLGFVRGQTVTFDTSDSTVATHPFRFSPKVNGTHGTTDYSVDFDGNDRLIIPASSDLSMTTTDFTFEAWVYPTNYGEIVGAFNENPNYKGWLFSLDFDSSNGKMAAFISGGGSYTTQKSNSVVPTGQWSHVVLTKSGTTYTFFLNGLKDGSFTSSISIQDSTQNVNIGADTNTTPGRYLTGKISNLRIVQGTVVYTSNFTPPTEPLTNITNTKLLCCNNSSVTGATVTPGTITTGGDPASSTDTPYDTYPFSTVTSISEGSAGAATTITFPHNAPDDLYYYCTAHSGMGGAIGLRTDVQIADPYAWKNTLALTGVAATDSSNLVNCTNSAKTLTFNGNAAVNGEKSNFYCQSFKFDGTGDYISVPDNADFDFGGGDFTIELFMNSTTTGTNSVLIGANTGWYVQLKDSTKDLSFYTGSTEIVYSDDATSAICNGKWRHIAITREGNTIRHFIDGVIVKSTTNTDAVNLANALNIGRYGAGTLYFTGYMNDVRIYKGLAKYTENFYPASTDPQITIDSPSGVAYSSALAKPTNGSVDFDGSGDYLSMPVNNSDFDWAADGSLTIEAFVNMDAITGQTYNSIINRWGGSGTYSFGLDIKNNGNLFFYRGNGSSISTHESSGITIGLNQWYHIAVVKDGTTGRFFINGQACGTFSWNQAFTNSTNIPLNIGNLSDGNSYPIDGRISNARIVNGTAVYRSNFVPPSAPLTNITNTKLLCCNSSVLTGSTVANGTITAYGNPVLGDYPFDSGNDFVQGKSSGYCILNSVDKHSGALSQGALRFTNSGTANVSGTLAMPRNSGKYYWEVHGEDVSGGVTGIGAFSINQISNLADMHELYGYSPNGQKYLNKTAFDSSTITSGGTSYGATWTTGDTVSVLFDTDTNKLTFWKNGSTQGVAYDVNGEYDYFPQTHCNDTELLFNFGQNPFKYKPPVGYKTLNTANIPTPEIIRSDHFVGITTWSGEFSGNAGTLRHMPLDFQPDFVWIKQRNQAYSSGHQLYDSVRGAGAEKEINISADANEGAGNIETYGWINSFDARKGFTTKGGSSDSDYVNQIGVHYVAWCWKAGGNKNTFNIDDVGYASAAAANMSAGALNSSTMNQTQTWSGLFSSGLFDQAITNAFNGILSEADRARTSGNQVLITMTLSTPVTVSSEIKVYGESNYASTATVTVGGVTHTSATNDVHTFKVSGSLTQMTLTGNSASGRTYMEGMMIDNKLLVDNGVSINKPSIAATGASAGTKQGFSIIKYEGNGTANQTIAHGLEKTPSFIMIKRLDGGSGNTGDWMGAHAHMSGWRYYMVPNKNQAQTNDFSPFVGYPTDSVFSVSSSDRVNNSGNDYVAYVWADIPGVQKFGLYYGNGNANGPFINTGFRPSIIWYKDRGNVGYWNIRDDKRTPFNGIAQELYTAEPDVENHHNTRDIDFLSNGFKIKDSHDAINNSSRQYMYMCWGESSQFNLYGGQSNAR